MNWGQDLQMEGLLQDLGITPKVQDVLVAKILLEASLKNNACFGEVLISTNVDSIFGALTSDEPTHITMPMTVVDEQPNGYFVLSGNNRIAAAVRAGLKTIPCYVVNVDDELKRDRICREANKWHGVKLSPEEAARHALALMERYSMTLSLVKETMAYLVQLTGGKRVNAKRGKAGS